MQAGEEVDVGGLAHLDFQRADGPERAEQNHALDRAVVGLDPGRTELECSDHARVALPAGVERTDPHPRPALALPEVVESSAGAEAVHRQHEKVLNAVVREGPDLLQVFRPLEAVLGLHVGPLRLGQQERVDLPVGQHVGRQVAVQAHGDGVVGGNPEVVPVGVEVTVFSDPRVAEDPVHLEGRLEVAAGEADEVLVAGDVVEDLEE